MANEINISAVTGLTINLQLYQGITSIGSPFSSSEIGTTGEYIADMPITPAGIYLIIATVGNDIKIASGEILWDGEREVIIGTGLNVDVLHKLSGAKLGSPADYHKSYIKVDDIEIKVSGDPDGITTLTRKA